MKYQVVATFKWAHKRYLHAVDVDYYERYYEVVNYSWHDDAIIFVLQSKEVRQ